MFWQFLLSRCFVELRVETEFNRNNNIEDEHVFKEKRKLK